MELWLVLVVCSLLVLSVAFLILQITKNNQKRTNLAETSIDSVPDDSKKATGASVAIMVVILLFFLVLFVVVIWSNFKRYQIASDAIQKGNASLAMAALSPEIGEGVGNLVREITGNGR